MSAIRLLVLGAVRQHGRAHGYMVRNDLEFWGAHEWSNAKPGSIYHALKQLAKQEMLTAYESAPSPDGGPPRTEYELTEAGEAEYFRLLRHALTAIDEKADVFTSGIGFLIDLPRAEAIALLRERVDALKAWRAEITPHWTVGSPGAEELGHIGEVVSLWMHTSDSAAEWTEGLIQRLERGTYVMAGEGRREPDVLPEGVPNPYADGGTHRIDVTPTPAGVRRVRVTRHGVELASSTRPVLLAETGYPDRYYLPPADIRLDLLVPTRTHTHCPFKGDASYWAPREDPRTDIAWAYPSPKRLVEPIRDHLCFHEADGVRVEVIRD